MGDIPYDAQRVLDDLRSSRRSLPARSWTPSESFDSTLLDLAREPVTLNDHLGWLHKNWDLGPFLQPPPGRGLKGMVKRLIHRATLAVFGAYFERLQDCIGVTVRALDTVARRVDEDEAAQLRLLGAVRSDLIEFAHHVDERADA